jgi:hypothetical protein
MDAQVVPFRVFEPRRLLGSKDTDVIHRLQFAKVVVLEHHARTLQLCNAGGNVDDSEADRGMVTSNVEYLGSTP